MTKYGNDTVNKKIDRKIKYEITKIKTRAFSIEYLRIETSGFK